jgi:hypothetical protein
MVASLFNGNPRLPPLGPLSRIANKSGAPLPNRLEQDLKFIVEGDRPTSAEVADGIRRYYPATYREAEEGYGRIVVLRDGEPPMTLCSFLLDMETEDILTLFWVKMKENFPKAEIPR